MVAMEGATTLSGDGGGDARLIVGRRGQTMLSLIGIKSQFAGNAKSVKSDAWFQSGSSRLVCCRVWTRHEVSCAWSRLAPDTLR
jgi:hypothetical protein